MKIRMVLVAAAITVLAAGCAQQPLPRPYPGSEVDPAEPAVSAEGPDQISSGPRAQGAAPQPIAAPEIDAADTGSLDQSAAPQFRALPDEAIDARIRAYEDKLEQWQQLDQQSGVASLDAERARLMADCFRDLQSLLNGYQALQAQSYRMAAGASRFEQGDVVSLLQRDIDFTEGRCQELLNGSGSGPAGYASTGTAGSIAELEELIGKHYEEEAYEQVIDVWAQIPAYQKERVSQAALLQYGNAHARLGRPAEAAKVYQQVVDGMSGAVLQANSPLLVRKRLADLYVAAGNFFGAEGQYEQLSRDYQQIGTVDEWARLQLTMLERSMKGSPELTDYSELLRGYLAFSPALDGYAVVWRAETFLQNYPYSPVSANVEIIKDETLQLADQWLSEKLTEADQFAENDQVQEALALLQGVPQDKLSPDKLAIVKDKMDALVLADAVERETQKIEQLQALQSIWNQGTAQADSGDFDGAIQTFNQLFGTEYEQRARERVNELALTAAKNERRRAADIFVRSTKAGDIESQKTLLAESWQVLNDILQKYPEVEIADRVKGNIGTVEKRINDVDPALLGDLKARQIQRQESLVEPELELDGFDIESFDQVPPEPRAAPAPLPVYTPQSLQMQ